MLDSVMLKKKPAGPDQTKRAVYCGSFSLPIINADAGGVWGRYSPLTARFQWCSSSMGKRRNNQIDGQFNARTIEMLESPAHRVLSLSGRKALDRIFIELAHHGGNDNGRLLVTYDQFVDYGIHRHAVGPALREIEALGFIEITQRGKASAGEHRWPNYFRLTCVNCASGRNPTHEWRRLKTVEDAERIASAARNAKPARKTRPKNISPVTENANSGVGNHHRKADSPVSETITTVPVSESITTSISRDVRQSVGKASNILPLPMPASTRRRLRAAE
jgi:hypothetical protein